MDKLQQYAEAIPDSEMAFRLDPGDERIRKLRDWLTATLARRGYLAQEGKQADAFREYDAALRLSPGDPVLYDRRARAFIE